MSKRKKKNAPEGEASKVIERAEVEGLNLEFADDEELPSLEEMEELVAAAEDAPEVEAANDEDNAAEMGATSEDEASAEDEFPVSADEDDASGIEASSDAEGALAGTELENFETAEIEDVEVLIPEQIRSIVESALFATDKPVSIAQIKQVFKGTNVKSKDVREALSALQEEYGASTRGFTLEEIAGGFQLRTKPDNMKYLRQSVKARPFKLSGPALEVLSIVAYKQPATKNQIDEIRGVESGHLLRALMEKHLVTFGERSDLPGKPMFYETTKKFLEIFSLRNLAELPSLAEIDQLIPEGIGDVEEKETLSDLTGQLSQEVGSTYSEAEDELLKITDELTQISTSSEFFEDEKRRERERRDRERAQSIREAQAIGETVEDKDAKWLERYEQQLAEAEAAKNEVAFVAGENEAPVIGEPELAAIEAEEAVFDAAPSAEEPSDASV